MVTTTATCLELSITARTTAVRDNLHHQAPGPLPWNPGQGRGVRGGTILEVGGVVHLSSLVVWERETATGLVTGVNMTAMLAVRAILSVVATIVYSSDCTITLKTTAVRSHPSLHLLPNLSQEPSLSLHQVES